MATPPLKPIRIPPSIGEEDREYLARKRTRQNFTYQSTIYILECIRKHDEIPVKYWYSGIDATKSYLQQLENREKEEKEKLEIGLTQNENEL